MSRLTSLWLVMIILCISACDDSHWSAATEPTPAARQDPDIRAPVDLKLQRGLVGALAFSPDGATLAAAGDMDHVFVWDTVKGERREALEGAPRGATAIDFSPDGKMLAVGSAGGQLACWDALTGAPLASTRLDRGIKSIAFTDNSNVVATSWDDVHIGIRTFDARTGRETSAGKAKGHASRTADGRTEPREPRHVAFSPDGKLLATTTGAVWDTNVGVWDVRSGQQLHQLGYTGDIVSMAFSPDSATLAAGDFNGNVRFWDIGGGGGKSTGVHGIGDAPADAVAFSPDGKVLAVSAQRFVHFVSVPDGKELAKLHMDLGSVTALAFSPGGKFVAFSDNLSGLHIRAVPESSSAKDKSGIAARAPAKPGLLILEQATDPRTSRPFVAVAFSSDGKTVAASNEDRVIRLYDVSAQRVRLLLEGHSGLPATLVFSPDGKLLASAATELMAASSAGVERPNSIRVWDVESGQVLGYVETQEQTFPGVCFSPDGKSLAAAKHDGVVRLLDAMTLRPRDGLAVKVDSGLSAIAFAPNGKRLALGTGNMMVGKLHVIDAASSKEIFSKDLAKPVTSVAFSPDGRWLAAVGGEVRVYDAANGRQVATPQHRYAPWCATFSPDGKTLATSAGEVKLWEVGTWRQRGEHVPERPDEYRSIAWSPDGASIAIAGGRGVVVWTPPKR